MKMSCGGIGLGYTLLHNVFVFIDGRLDVDGVWQWRAEGRRLKC